MKKYSQVKVIDEENEEDINDDLKEEHIQNDFFTKDQEPNERRKLIRSEKLRMENGRSKTLINFNKLFDVIGWNKDEKRNNTSNQSFVMEEQKSSSEESEKNSENDLDIFSEDENFLETNHNKNKRNYFDESIIFKDNYSFKQTYINLIKQIKGEKIILSRNVKNKLLFNLQINVGDFIVSESLFYNYVNYELEGKIKRKNFTLYRRYSEFSVYRKLLRKNWPGVFIPFLPPKKTYGNLDDTFILMRRKFLQYFCNKICSSPHLASSFETKIFLEPKNENFLELPVEI